MARRSYSGASQATTLNNPITAVDVSFSIGSATNLPTSNFVMTIDTGAGEEKVLVGSRTGTTLLSVTRGYDGTTATAHSSGASIRHTLSAIDLDEANAHINAAATHVSLVTTPTATNAVALVVKGLVSQTANLQEWQTSTGSPVAAIANDGAVTALAGIYARTTAARTIAVFAESDSAGRIPMLAKGASGQSANLQEWQQSGGNVVAKVDKDGNFTAALLFSLVGRFIPNFNGTVALIVGQNAGNTTNLQEWWNSSGSAVAKIASGGNFATSYISAVNGSGPSIFMDTGQNNGSRSITIPGNATTDIVLSVRGAASHTGNLQEWQNSSGTGIAAISASGGLVTTGLANFASQTVATASPSAGGGGALPATPLGYWSVFLNGAIRQIAYY